MNEKEIIDIEQTCMANTYSKRPVVIVKGRGATLWDVNGQEYIDCMGAYGVCVVGHSHPRVVDAIQQQAASLIACHSSLYNDARSTFLKKIVDVTPKELNKAFLANSGTETVEAAIKLARKHTGKTEIIAFMGGYHGKTFGSLSATWNKRYRTPFEPLVPGFKHVPYGRPERVKAAVTDETAAILVEPIQGEGGIKVPPNGFLGELREICDAKGALLICDEVQTGLGRTGRFFASEHFNVVPDVMCLAKAVGGGVPIGVMVAKEEVMASLKLGDHSSTFGGNPLTCAAASAAVDVVVEERLHERAASLGTYFMAKLKELQEKYRLVREVRGMGLMIGMEFRFDVYNLILGALKQGVLVLDAGRNVLRFLPPLVISKDQLNRVIEVLDAVIGEEERARVRR
ncbi:MAG: aspartate aminotransferase family protein [Candidatus Bathyarchaeota archaeon]|nr:aspartate aminotransferase family protein [Candidatus Bathyarchaeota archaeon]